MTQYIVARIELKRVQTYLFEIPRLSIMLGANVMLGELVRGLWERDPDDSSKGRFFDQPTERPASLPALAVRCGSGFPRDADQEEEWFQEVWRERLGEKIIGTESHRQLCESDREADPIRSGKVVQDDPFEIAIRTGVLVRDASRVEAVFPDEPSARHFLRSARDFLFGTVPEIDAACSLWKVDGDDGSGTGVSDELDSIPMPEGSVATMDLPDAKTCELSRHALAETRIWAPDGEQVSVTTSVRRRHEAALRFNQAKTTDIMGLMHEAIFTADQWRLTDDQRPVTEFSQLARSGLMAVIHADGNGVGKRPGMISDALSKLDPPVTRASILEWSVREAMFWNNRRSVRRSLAGSIAELQSGADRNDRPRTDVAKRIRMLMLGGDDILVVCDAPLAIPLILRAADLLDDYSRFEPKADQFHEAFAPLTLGIGIAFVSPSLPFRRANELAEQLAGSAKRLAGSQPSCHVIDWCISKTSWIESPAISRRNEFMVNALAAEDPEAAESQDYLLSARPYTLLANDDSRSDTPWSLSRIWKDATELAQMHLIARSQLRGLEDAFAAGPGSAVLAAYDLPTRLRNELLRRGYLFDIKDSSLMDAVWEPVVGRAMQTRLLDLVELYEVARLDIQDNEAYVGTEETLEATRV